MHLCSLQSPCPVETSADSHNLHMFIIAMFVKKGCLCFLRRYSTLSLPMTASAGGQLWVATASFLTPMPAIPQHPYPLPQGWQKQHQPYISVTHGPNDKHVNGREKGKGQKREAFVSLWLCLCVCGLTMKVACSITRPWFSALPGNSQPWWGQQRASVGERESG